MSLRFPITGRSVDQCRKDAKKLRYSEGIPLHEALDRVAMTNSNNLWNWKRAMAFLKGAEESGLLDALERFKENATTRFVSKDGEVGFIQPEDVEKLTGIMKRAGERAPLVIETGGVTTVYESYADTDEVKEMEELMDFMSDSSEDMKATANMFGGSKGLVRMFNNMFGGSAVDHWHRRAMDQPFYDEIWRQLKTEGLINKGKGSEAGKRQLQLIKQRMAEIGDPYPSVDIGQMERDGFADLAERLRAGADDNETRRKVGNWIVGQHDGLS